MFHCECEQAFAPWFCRADTPSDDVGESGDGTWTRLNTTTEETSGADLYHAVKRRQRRRDARTWAFVALAIVGLLWIPRVTMPALLRTTAGEPGWRIFRESKKGWTLTYPADWHAQRIAEVYRGRYDQSAYGIFVSNVDRELTHPTSRWVFSTFDTNGLRADFVAVRVQWRYGGGPLPTCPQWGTPLPLSFKNAKKPLYPEGANGAPQPQLTLSFIARGEPSYSVTAWIGPAASAGDRAIVERIVSSISFDDAPKTFPSPPPDAPLPDCGF